MKKTGKAFAILVRIAGLAILCAALWETPALAKKTGETVRVGYPIQKRLTETDELGRRSGYSYDYLMEIAKYTGWNYEFVEVEGTLDEQLIAMLEMLESGEIDLLGGMLYSEALSEIYDYPGTSYGTSYFCLCALDSNTGITSGNYYLLPKLRVAVYSPSGKRNEKLEQFAQMSGITVEQIFCTSEEEMLSLLEEEKADALLSKEVSLPTDNLNIIARFSPQPYYFATTKGKKQIVNGLDEALVAISRDNPYFAANLSGEYFAMQSGNFYYSAEEKEYIRQTGRLRAVIFGGRPPIQYIDEETGEYRGVSLDVLSCISESTGLTFDTVMTESFEEYANIIKNGEADIAVGVTDELYQYDWQDIMTTMPYLEAPVSIVLTENLKPEDIEGKRLAMAQGIHYDGDYKGKVSYFETCVDCLDAVHGRKADYCYATAYSVHYYISDPERRNLIAIPQDEEWQLRFCIGILDPKNQRLAGILNKAIQDFSGKGLLQSFLYENAYRQDEVTLKSYLRTNPLEAVMLFTLFLMTAGVVIVSLLWRKDKKNQRLRKLENERYEQLSEISNELLFEYDVPADRMKLSEKCAEYLGMPRLIERVSRAGDGSGPFSGWILNRKEASGELQLPVAGGEIHWMRIITKDIKDTNGNDICLVGKLTDIQQEKEEKEMLQVKAERDSLTGVYNIATFREKASAMYERSGAEYYAFYIIDIDYFKQVNDTFGHYIGDIVLEKLGRILLEVFSGEEEETGRLGGDEFVVQTVYRGDLDAVRRRCGRLNDAASRIEFEGRTDPVTVSIGVAIAKAGKDFETVYRRADEALYQVKREGRGSFRIYMEGEKADE